MDQLMKLGPFAAIGRVWSQLNSSQRVVVTAFAAVAIVAMVVISMVASKPRMAVLFSRLEPEDAGAICQKLSEQKVPYELSADSSTIEVPASQVADLRLSMTSQGLPQGGTVGFEIFDKSNLGMTEFGERMSYLRAVQGELTRTIEHLAPVVKARVHITMPQESIYTSEQEPTKASVELKLRRGTPLGDEQVGGVVHLVASAVDGLKPENITVIDDQGNVLSEAGAHSGAGGLLTANQTKIKRQYESEMAKNLETMLARILGPDKAVVRVSADMNFDEKQEKSETYLPAAPGVVSTATATQGTAQVGMSAKPGQTTGPSGVLSSQESTSEEYSGSAVPSGVSSRPGSPSDHYSRTESTTQYQVAKSTVETVSAPGQLTRLSVAVLVDDKVDMAKVGTIKSAVMAAVGFNPERKDQVTVESIAFDQSSKKEEDAAAAKESRMSMITSIGKTVGAVALLLAFLMFLKGTVNKIKVQLPAPQAPVQYAPVPQSVGDLLRDQSAPSEPVHEEPKEQQAMMPVSDLVPKDIAQSSPEELARLVRTWMSEG